MPTGGTEPFAHGQWRAHTKDLTRARKKNHHLYLLQISSPCSGNSPSHHVPEKEKKKKKKPMEKCCCASLLCIYGYQRCVGGRETLPGQSDVMVSPETAGARPPAGQGWAAGTEAAAATRPSHTPPGWAWLGTTSAARCRPARVPDSRGDGSAGRRAAPARAAPASSQTPEPPRALGSRITP